MSGKSAKIKPAKKPEPRALDEIQREYQELCNKAGQLQYQSVVIAKELEDINEQLFAINYEAADRNKLDKAAAEETKAQETANAQQ